MHAHDGEERMAHCTGCMKWYHKSFENIAQTVFSKDDSNDWKCKVCIAGKKQFV